MTVQPHANQSVFVTVVSLDPGFIQECRSVFGQSREVGLTVCESSFLDAFDQLLTVENQLLVLDVEPSSSAEIDNLVRLKKRQGDALRVVIVANNFAPQLVRIMVQLQICDLVMKPISTSEFVRTCNRAWGGDKSDRERGTKIVTFLPAAGGVGNTTLALQTAAILQAENPRHSRTCIVDLNLQNSACAEYLDLEPLFDISEVETRPDRLDSQLLNLMLSHHENGLAILSAPSDPTDMRAFQPELIIRILDLVSAHFDNIVIDLPRTWFPWTQHVLLGSDQVFIVAEMTVPCIRNTQRLVEAVAEKVGRTVDPKVIINRAEATKKNATIRPSDLEELLGDKIAGTVTNNYQLVRTALDKGILIEEVQKNANVLQDLQAIVCPPVGRSAKARSPRKLIRNLFARRQTAQAA